MDEQWNKNHNIIIFILFLDSEKIRLLTEELIESSKQMLLWIIGFSVALAVCVLFIIITCTITILR